MRKRFDRSSAPLAIIIGVFTISSITSCKNYTPKPHGYPKIDFPERSYQRFEDGCAFSFDIPVYGKMEADTHPSAEKCWYNLTFPGFDATIYLSYKTVNSKAHLDTLSEEAYKLAMKNNIKADVINETEILDTQSGNFSMLYDLYGETATPFNFYVTDRNNNYLRGAFYFNQYTKTDSVAPIFDFLKVDIMRMIQTVEWENPKS